MTMYAIVMTACVLIFSTIVLNSLLADYEKNMSQSSIGYELQEAIRLIDKYFGEPKEESVIEEVYTDENIGDIRLLLARETIDSYIKAHYMDDISMHNLAHFCKLFKQCFKVNFTSYLTEYRISVAKKMLEDPRLNIKDIGTVSGYTDSNYFARVFKRITGCTPTEYRANILANRKN